MEDESDLFSFPDDFGGGGGDDNHSAATTVPSSSSEPVVATKKSSSSGKTLEKMAKWDGSLEHQHSVIHLPWTTRDACQARLKGLLEKNTIFRQTIEDVTGSSDLTDLTNLMDSCLRWMLAMYCGSELSISGFSNIIQCIALADYTRLLGILKVIEPLTPCAKVIERWRRQVIPDVAESPGIFGYFYDHVYGSDRDRAEKSWNPADFYFEAGKEQGNKPDDERKIDLEECVQKLERAQVESGKHGKKGSGSGDSSEVAADAMAAAPVWLSASDHATNHGGDFLKDIATAIHMSIVPLAETPGTPGKVSTHQCYITRLPIPNGKPSRIVILYYASQPPRLFIMNAASQPTPLKNIKLLQDIKNRTGRARALQALIKSSHNSMAKAAAAAPPTKSNNDRMDVDVVVVDDEAEDAGDVSVSEDEDEEDEEYNDKNDDYDGFIADEDDEDFQPNGDEEEEEEAVDDDDDDNRKTSKKRKRSSPEEEDVCVNEMSQLIVMNKKHPMASGTLPEGMTIMWGTPLARAIRDMVANPAYAALTTNEGFRKRLDAWRKLGTQGDLSADFKRWMSVLFDSGGGNNATTTTTTQNILELQMFLTRLLITSKKWSKWTRDEGYKNVKRIKKWFDDAGAVDKDVNAIQTFFKKRADNPVVKLPPSAFGFRFVPESALSIDVVLSHISPADESKMVSALQKEKDYGRIPQCLVAIIPIIFEPVSDIVPMVATPLLSIFAPNKLPE